MFEWHKHMLFKGMKGSKLKKTCMFFMCHRYRKFEKYVMTAQDDDGNFTTWKQEYLETKRQTKHYVVYNFPFVLMMAPTAISLGVMLLL